MFLDQSPPATVVGPDDVATTVAAPPSAAPAAVAQIGFEPRMNGGRVTGVVVQPRGSGDAFRAAGFARSEEHTSELQSLMRISYAVFCLKKQIINYTTTMHA